MEKADKLIEIKKLKVVIEANKNEIKGEEEARFNMIAKMEDLRRSNETLAVDIENRDSKIEQAKQQNADNVKYYEK